MYWDDTLASAAKPKYLLITDSAYRIAKLFIPIGEGQYKCTVNRCIVLSLRPQFNVWLEKGGI